MAFPHRKKVVGEKILFVSNAMMVIVMMMMLTINLFTTPNSLLSLYLSVFLSKNYDKFFCSLALSVNGNQLQGQPMKGKSIEIGEWRWRRSVGVGLF